MDWTNLINTLGFPVVCVIACGWFILTMYNNNIKEQAIREERNQAREEKSYTMLGGFQTTIDKFADILSIYESKLNVIEADVKEIKEIVNK